MDMIAMYNMTEQLPKIRKNKYSNRTQSITQKKENWAIKIHDSLVNITDFDKASITPAHSFEIDQKLVCENYNSLLKTCRRSVFSHYIRE
jgi:hypothetical protein